LRPSSELSCAGQRGPIAHSSGTMIVAPPPPVHSSDNAWRNARVRLFRRVETQPGASRATAASEKPQGTPLARRQPAFISTLRNDAVGETFVSTRAATEPRIGKADCEAVTLEHGVDQEKLQATSSAEIPFARPRNLVATERIVGTSAVGAQPVSQAKEADVAVEHSLDETVFEACIATPDSASSCDEAEQSEHGFDRTSDPHVGSTQLASNADCDLASVVATSCGKATQLVCGADLAAVSCEELASTRQPYRQVPNEDKALSSSTVGLATTSYAELSRNSGPPAAAWSGSAAQPPCGVDLAAVPPRLAPQSRPAECSRNVDPSTAHRARPSSASGGDADFAAGGPCVKPTWPMGPHQPKVCADQCTADGSAEGAYAHDVARAPARGLGVQKTFGLDGVVVTQPVAWHHAHHVAAGIDAPLACQWGLAPFAAAASLCDGSTGFGDAQRDALAPAAWASVTAQVADTPNQHVDLRTKLCAPLLDRPECLAKSRTVPAKEHRANTGGADAPAHLERAAPIQEFSLAYEDATLRAELASHLRREFSSDVSFGKARSVAVTNFEEEQAAHEKQAERVTVQAAAQSRPNGHTAALSKPSSGSLFMDLCGTCGRFGHADESCPVSMQTKSIVQEFTRQISNSEKERDLQLEELRRAQAAEQRESSVRTRQLAEEFAALRSELQDERQRADALVARLNREEALPPASALGDQATCNNYSTSAEMAGSCRPVSEADFKHEGADDKQTLLSAGLSSERGLGSLLRPAAQDEHLTHGVHEDLLLAEPMHGDAQNLVSGQLEKKLSEKQRTSERTCSGALATVPAASAEREPECSPEEDEAPPVSTREHEAAEKPQDEARDEAPLLSASEHEAAEKPHSEAPDEAEEAPLLSTSEHERAEEPPHEVRDEAVEAPLLSISEHERAEEPPHEDRDEAVESVSAVKPAVCTDSGALSRPVAVPRAVVWAPAHSLRRALPREQASFGRCSRTGPPRGEHGGSPHVAPCGSKAKRHSPLSAVPDPARSPLGLIAREPSRQSTAPSREPLQPDAGPSDEHKPAPLGPWLEKLMDTPKARTRSTQRSTEFNIQGAFPRMGNRKRSSRSVGPS